MKITCHSCAAKYTVSDEKVQGKTVKMKCRKCGATIVVGGAQHADAPQDEATVAAGGPDAGGDLAAGSFLVNVNDGDQRTMTLAEVADAYRSGVVNADTYVWADGMTDWQPISENAAISAALHGDGGNGAANGNHTPAPANGGYTPPVAEPLAAAPAPAADTRPAARRDSNRRSGDLFSGGMSDGGLSSSLSSSASAGKRDENSVLFSLSALTSTAAAPAKTSVGSTTATKEDSGLIDLKALAAAPAPATAATPMLETVGLFPLGAPVLAPPPVAAPAAFVAEPPKAKSNMTAILALGVLAVAGISTAVFFAVKSGGNAAPTATVAANTTPTTPATDPTPPPAQPSTPSTTPTTPATDATPPASGAPSGAPTVPGKPGVPNNPNPNIKPPVTPTTPTTPKPPVTTPPKSACPCPPGDLMCAMQKCAGKK